MCLRLSVPQGEHVFRRTPQRPSWRTFYVFASLGAPRRPTPPRPSQRAFYVFASLGAPSANLLVTSSPR
jgi:hypothetical protein